jgi:coenzyme F420 hydrogenase subunit beta
MVNNHSVGIRPRFRKSICDTCSGCLSICPGICIDACDGYTVDQDKYDDHPLIGRTIQIVEGYAADEEIRFRASSGGLLSALSLYCLEREGMDFVLHTGADPKDPLVNRTVLSRNKKDLLSRCGSRYAPSSPCDSLKLIEQNDNPSVFIGKPCDTAAVAMLRKKNARLDANLGLVLTFFCAGTPSTQGTLQLLHEMGIDHHAVNGIRYRGEGWPGYFRAAHDNGLEKRLSYSESWGYLQKYRCFRCQLCPDGLGEMADISCGDAWHRYNGDDNPGLSLALVRSERGREILGRAKAAGYLELVPSTSAQVISAQGLAERRKVVFGRLLALRMMLIPTPRFEGFQLRRAWKEISFLSKLHSVIGTWKRVIVKGLWRKKSLVN